MSASRTQLSRDFLLQLELEELRTIVRLWSPVSQLGQLHFVKMIEHAHSRIESLKPTVSWVRVARMVALQTAPVDVTEEPLEEPTTREKDMDAYIAVLARGGKMNLPREYLHLVSPPLQLRSATDTPSSAVPVVVPPQVAEGFDTGPSQVAGPALQKVLGAATVDIADSGPRFNSVPPPTHSRTHGPTRARSVPLDTSMGLTSSSSIRLIDQGTGTEPTHHISSPPEAGRRPALPEGPADDSDRIGVSMDRATHVLAMPSQRPSGSRGASRQPMRGAAKAESKARAPPPRRHPLLAVPKSSTSLLVLHKRAQVSARATPAVAEGSGSAIASAPSSSQDPPSAPIPPVSNPTSGPSLRVPDAPATKADHSMSQDNARFWDAVHHVHFNEFDDMGNLLEGDRHAVGDVAAVARDYRHLSPSGEAMAILLHLPNIPLRLHATETIVTAEARWLVRAIKDGEVGLEKNLHISQAIRINDEIVYRRVASFDGIGAMLLFCPGARITLDPLVHNHFTSLGSDARFAFNFRIDEGTFDNRVFDKKPQVKSQPAQAAGSSEANEGAKPVWRPDEAKVAKLSAKDQAILEWLLETENARLDSQASVYQMRKARKRAPGLRRMLRWMRVIEGLVGHKIQSAAGPATAQGQRTTQGAVAVYLARGNDWMRLAGIARRLLRLHWHDEEVRIMLRDLHERKARPGMKRLLRLLNGVLQHSYAHVRDEIEAGWVEDDTASENQATAASSDTDWDSEEASLLAGPDTEEADPSYNTPEQSRPTTPTPYAPDDPDWTDGPNSPAEETADSQQEDESSEQGSQSGEDDEEESSEHSFSGSDGDVVAQEDHLPPPDEDDDHADDELDNDHGGSDDDSHTDDDMGTQSFQDEVEALQEAMDGANDDLFEDDPMASGVEDDHDHDDDRDATLKELSQRIAAVYEQVGVGPLESFADDTVARLGDTHDSSAFPVAKPLPIIGAEGPPCDDDEMTDRDADGSYDEWEGMSF